MSSEHVYDPHCPHCRENVAIIQQLETKIATLEVKLAAALKNSKNSSKPPSSDLVKPKTTPVDPKKRKPKRTIGAQPGHKKHARVPFPPEKIDHVENYQHEVPSVVAQWNCSNNRRVCCSKWS
jgi:transposase